MQTAPFQQAQTMSYRETLAWACLASVLVVYIPYYRHLYYWVFRGTHRPGTPYPYDSLAVVGWTVVLQIVLLAVATSFITLWSKPENRDERDAAIEARAYRYAYLTLSGLVGTLLFASRFILAAFPFPIEHQDEAPFLFQLLLLSFVVAETIRYCIQVIGYRRGQ